MSGNGFSAYQMVFGSNPVDLFGWGGKDEDLMFPQDTSVAGQFAQQRKLRMRAQEDKVILNGDESNENRKSALGVGVIGRLPRGTPGAGRGYLVNFYAQTYLSVSFSAI